MRMKRWVIVDLFEHTVINWYPSRSAARKDCRWLNDHSTAKVLTAQRYTILRTG